MPKDHLKIIGLTLLIFTIVEASKPKTQQEILALAKRSLLEREHELFKTQPMSEDLRSFIERYKKRDLNRRAAESNNEDKREKRSQAIDENLLYVIQNGQLVPFRSIKDNKRSDEEKNEETADSFTVVPLVIPIDLKAQSEPKLVKTRTLDESEKNENKKRTTTSEGFSTSTQKFEIVAGEDNDEDNSTKEESKVLHKILEDVEGLMRSSQTGNKKEGVLCNINGSWISDAAGMRFDICYKNSTRKKFRVHLADRIPPNEDGFLCDGNWTVFGELPFLHSGMVIALAVHEKDKHIATFIGECRICEGSETVTGTWLLGRSSRDCKDQKASHKILSDVWKREQGHTLRKKHLQQIGITDKDED